MLSSSRPTVLQSPLGVEHEDLRQCDHLERPGGRLGVAVVEVGELELPVSGSIDHAGERIGHVRVGQLLQRHGLRAVGVDRDNGNAALTVVGVKTLDPLLVELGHRTVVAGEDDDEHRAAGVLVERMRLAVDPMQPERRRRGADGQRGRSAVGAGCRNNRENDEDGPCGRRKDCRSHRVRPPHDTRTGHLPDPDQTRTKPGLTRTRPSPAPPSPRAT